MKKKIKKISALILALCMVMAMGITSAAAGMDEKKAELKITDIEEGATVTLYQIGTAAYNDNKDTFIKFNYVSPINEDKSSVTLTEKGPTSQEINTIANGIKAGSIKAAAADTKTVGADGVYTYKANAGVYVAIITGGEKIYNPILLAASFTGEGNLEGGEINLATAKYLYGETAVAKKSEPTVDKKEAGGTTDNTITETDKITASVGDEITYTVTPSVPAYPENAVNKTFYISDSMSEGLTFEYATLTVTIDNTAITANTEGKFISGGKTIAEAKETSNGFNLSFDYDEVKGKSPVVTYKAVINEKAVVGKVGNTNDVKLYYTTTPNSGSTYKDLENTPDNAEGIKKKEDKKTVYTYEIAFKKVDDKGAVITTGATFGIYKTKDSNGNVSDLVDIVKTNDKGIAVSKQVEAGTYYVKEIAAPEGYSLNEEVFTVEAKWTTATSTVTTTTTTTLYTTTKSEAMDSTQVGWIKNGVFYSMETYTAETAAAAGASAAYVASQSTNTNETITTEQGAGAGVVTLTDIPNTKLSKLPSTGGIGTYIFTIVGVVIMVVAGVMFVSARKKRA